MKLTILVPRTESDCRVAEVLQHYSSAGLVRPFILHKFPDQGTWVDNSTKAEYANLNDLMAEVEECDLIRFICFSASTSTVDVNDYVAAVSELRRSMNRTDIETTFGSVNLCAADDRHAYELFGDYNRYFNYNLVILPEDSLGERNSPTLTLKAANRREALIANILAIVGGLWWWLDEAPLDAMQHSGEGDLQRVRLAKATARMTKSQDLVSDAIVKVLSGDGKRLLPRECVAHMQPDRAINDLYDALIRPGGVSPIGFSYRPFRKAEPPARKKLGILAALQLFLNEFMVELRNVPKSLLQGLKGGFLRRVRRIEGRVEQMVEDQTFGPDSRIMVGVRDTNDVHLMMDQAARCRELDQIPDLGDYRAYPTPGIWKTLTKAIVSAADGGDVPSNLRWSGLEWHERRAVVEDLDLLAPDLGSGTHSVIRPHDVQAIRAVLMSDQD